MSAGSREDETTGGFEVEGDDPVEEEWSMLVLVGSANEVELTVVLGTGEVVAAGEVVVEEEVVVAEDVVATEEVVAAEEVVIVLLVGSAKGVELAVMLDTGGVVTAPLEGKITSTSMTAVALLDGGRKNSDVPRVAARTEGLSVSNRDKTLEDVT